MRTIREFWGMTSLQVVYFAKELSTACYELFGRGMSLDINFDIAGCFHVEILVIEIGSFGI